VDTVSKPDAYCVWDTETGKWWGTQAYRRAGAAKNSWNAANGGYRYRGPGKTFNEQTRYIVRPVRLVPLDIE
jgi:hypothetical protein